MTTLVKELNGTCQIVVHSHDDNATALTSTPRFFADISNMSKNDKDIVGVLLEGDLEIETVVGTLISFPILALNFAAFADGRGLTQATLLRTRYNFSGEIRAVGEVLPDWTPFMYRSGFNAFELANEADAETAINCINRITDHYQGSAREPKPAFRRHTLS